MGRGVSWPTKIISLRAPWLELPVASFVNSMATVYEGVLNGVIRQMPIAAWFGAQCRRIQLTIVLPSTAPLDRWQPTLIPRTSCWPVRLPQEVAELHPPSKATFIRLRKRGQSKHILGGMKINWKLIDQNLWTAGPTALDHWCLHGNWQPYVWTWHLLATNSGNALSSRVSHKQYYSHQTHPENRA